MKNHVRRPKQGYELVAEGLDIIETIFKEKQVFKKALQQWKDTFKKNCSRCGIKMSWKKYYNQNKNIIVQSIVNDKNLKEVDLWLS